MSFLKTSTQKLNEQLSALALIYDAKIFKNGIDLKNQDASITVFEVCKKEVFFVTLKVMEETHFLKLNLVCHFEADVPYLVSIIKFIKTTYQYTDKYSDVVVNIISPDLKEARELLSSDFSIIRDKNKRLTLIKIGEY